MSLEYRIREMLPTDEGFVARSWTATARCHGTMLKVDAGLFSNWHHPIVEELLKSPTTIVKVAAPIGDDDTVYGFAVYEAGCIHCVYVRKTFRRLGIAKALLQGVSIPDCSFSTWSKDVSQWAFEKYPGLRYLPLWLFMHPKRGTDANAKRNRSQVSEAA